MGVLGLWQILESVGHPIKVEGLEGKRLGVDANVWLYKFIRGFREKETGINLESHKLGLFNRVSKLLFYKIKPVFVFDGPAPTLKRRTLERRQNIRYKNLSKVQNAAMKVLAEQLKKQYPDADIDHVRIQLPEFRSNTLVAAEKLTDDDRELFYLPPEQPKQEHDNNNKRQDEDDDDDDFSDSEYDVKFVPYSHGHVDIESKDFESLPPEIRYEILHDVKSKKRISNPEALPDDPNSFSSFQLKRLNARRSIQAKIEQCEREICNEISPLVVQYEGQKEPEFDIRKREPTSSQTQYYDTHQAAAGVSDTTGDDIDHAKTNRPEHPSNTLLAVDETTDDDSDLFPPTPEPPKQEHNNKEKDVELSEPEDDLKLTSHSEVHDQSRDPHNSTIEIHTSVAEDLSDTTDDDSDLLFIPVEHPKQQHTNNNRPHDDHETDKSSESEDDVEIIPQPTVHNESKDLQNSTLEILYENLPGIDLQKQTSSPEALPDESNSLPSPQSKRPDAEETIQAEVEQNEPVIQDQVPPPVVQQEDQKKPESDIPKQAASSSETQHYGSQQRQALGASQTTASSSQATAAEGVTHTTAAASKRVTTKIIEEAKELLTLFGVPYIDAAGEAEAQCALLERLNLTEGTITDDSDVWLFGAQNVYRHFFSDDKYVLQYKLKDIEFHLRLTRENMVCFAMLVGSDYTDGIMNVGPVTALEVLSEFPGPELEPLIKFKEWHDEQVALGLSKRRVANKRRAKLLKYNIPDEFPSRAVFEGYLRPAADSSEEKFTWGTPDLDELRDYARRNFGWDQKKADEKLLPVMKKLSERRTQTTIDTFFFKTSANQNPEMFRSKRINEALNKIAKRDDQVVCLSEDEEDGSDKASSAGGGSQSEGKKTTNKKAAATGRGAKTRAKTTTKATKATTTTTTTKKKTSGATTTTATKRRKS